MSGDLRALSWKSQAGFQVASHDTCYYIRESTGSVIAGAVFGVVFAVPTGIYGIWLLVTEPPGSSWVFAAMLLLISALFNAVLWTTVRRGRWMVVYDRGSPGRAAGIRYQGKELPAERVRGLSTKSVGGRTPQRTVVAELHDGTCVTLGPSAVSTWPAHWGQEAAAWMGLPFRHSDS